VKIYRVNNGKMTTGKTLLITALAGVATLAIWEAIQKTSQAAANSIAASNSPVLRRASGEFLGELTVNIDGGIAPVDGWTIPYLI